jgi:hypothetical protein
MAKGTSMKARKVILVIVVSISLVSTGCNAQWISVALADLPVLTQMALNIATLVGTLQSGKQLAPNEAAAIQNISSEASRDLNLLQSLYNEYKANPSASTLQKIRDAISAINLNLPALLRTTHISNPELSTRITAGVNLILTTVSSFAALIPQPTGQRTIIAGAAKSPLKTISPPNTNELKRSWAREVCSSTGNASLDAALVNCPIQ